MIAPIQEQVSGEPKRERKVLYIGQASEQIENMLEPDNTGIRLETVGGASDAFSIMRVMRCETVIADQRDYRAEIDLLIARVAGFKNAPRLIVLTGQSARDYSKVHGIYAVLAGDIKRETLLVAAGLESQQKPASPSLYLGYLAKAKSVLETMRERLGSGRRLMSTVSSLYKYSAFVLLAALFAAFLFYGIMIGFFLVSSGWAAPQTLSKGHELVTKVEQQVSDMRVNLNLVSQRYSEAELEANQAARTHEDAKTLMGFVSGTIDKEIAQRQARRSALLEQGKRLESLKSAFKRAIRDSGMERDLASIFEKRLITRRTFNSNVLGLLESGQRMAAMETDQATFGLDVAEIEQTIAMLTSLKEQVDTGKTAQIEGASADLVLLAKQAIDARSAYDQARTQFESARARQALLGNSKFILEERIGEVLKTPLGRATQARVDVLFIPYGNEGQFIKGEPLYVCALTIVFCRKIGQAGDVIAGESNTVHPFFGKPLRGFFAEALLDDPTAASAEVIHAGRPPFFF
jgi:hypothetical protein